LEIVKIVSLGDDMVDRLYSEADFAALYDAWWPRALSKDFDFYLPLVMSAESVLDVGCGTGAILHEARQCGHQGRLCGLDPAAGMLAQARKRGDIEWVLGDLASTAWVHEFDLVIMTGHAFQVLVEDEELRTSLAAIRVALTNNGHFAFETRNPLARAWENWTTENAVKVTAPDGTTVRITTRVETPFDERIVCFSHTFTSPTWAQPQLSRSTLRFLDADLLSSFLADAGLVIEAQFGDWDRQRLTGTSPEIITIVRPSERGISAAFGPGAGSLGEF
jgi:SAM-dependent methyltransferase